MRLSLRCGAEFGSLAFASQSGAMGVAILNACKRLGIGLTQFVSMGNKADVSGNDLLEYWENDDRTKVIGVLPREHRQRREVQDDRQPGDARRSRC